jgi:hypothetical protein
MPVVSQDVAVAYGVGVSGWDSKQGILCGEDRPVVGRDREAGAVVAPCDARRVALFALLDATSLDRVHRVPYQADPAIATGAGDYTLESALYDQRRWLQALEEQLLRDLEFHRMRLARGTTLVRAIWSSPRGLALEAFARLPEVAAVVRRDDAKRRVCAVVHVGEGRFHFLLVDGFSGGSLQQFDEFGVKALELLLHGFRSGRCKWLRELGSFQLDENRRFQAPCQQSSDEVHLVLLLIT